MTAKMLFLLSFLVLQAAAETLLDMSHSVGEHSRAYVGYRPFERTRFHKGWQNKNQTLWVESFDVSFNEHMSTHMDAPRHFDPDGNTVDDIPLEDLIGPGVLIDMKDKAASHDNAELSTEDLQQWINKHGPLPDKAIIFVMTGWGKKYHNRTAYFGTDTNELSKLRFPALSREVAQFLASHQNRTGRRVLGVGIDGPSLDPGNSTEYPAHVILSAENIYLLENVANIEPNRSENCASRMPGSVMDLPMKLPVVGAEVTVMPIKFTNGTGGPTRILARIPDSVRRSTLAPSSTPAPNNTSTSKPSTSP